MAVRAEFCEWLRTPDAGNLGITMLPGTWTPLSGVLATGNALVVADATCNTFDFVSAVRAWVGTMIVPLDSSRYVLMVHVTEAAVHYVVHKIESRRRDTEKSAQPGFVNALRLASPADVAAFVPRVFRTTKWHVRLDGPCADVMQWCPTSVCAAAVAWDAAVCCHPPPMPLMRTVVLRHMCDLCADYAHCVTRVCACVPDALVVRLVVPELNAEQTSLVMRALASHPVCFALELQLACDGSAERAFIGAIPANLRIWRLDLIDVIEIPSEFVDAMRSPTYLPSLVCVTHDSTGESAASLKRILHARVTRHPGAFRVVSQSLRRSLRCKLPADESILETAQQMCAPLFDAPPSVPKRRAVGQKGAPARVAAVAAACTFDVPLPAGALLAIAHDAQGAELAVRQGVRHAVCDNDELVVPTTAAVPSNRFVDVHLGDTMLRVDEAVCNRCEPFHGQTAADGLHLQLPSDGTARDFELLAALEVTPPERLARLLGLATFLGMRHAARLVAGAWGYDANGRMRLSVPFG